MRNACRTVSNGFTLIETLIVLSLVIVIGSFALCVPFDSYRGSSFRTDRATLIAALQHARAEAMEDECEGSACVFGRSFGVFVLPDRYVIFQGDSYESRDSTYDEVVPANTSIVRSGLLEITFAAGTGNSSTTGDIVLSDHLGHISTTTIGAYGQIDWTN